MQQNKFRHISDSTNCQLLYFQQESIHLLYTFISNGDPSQLISFCFPPFYSQSYAVRQVRVRVYDWAMSPSKIPWAKWIFEHGSPKFQSNPLTTIPYCLYITLPFTSNVCSHISLSMVNPNKGTLVIYPYLDGF